MGEIYHYCSAETFLNIVKHRKLWLGDIRYMNDFMEVNWFMDSFQELLDIDLTDAHHKRLFENIKSNLSITKPYICCLSQSGDILSQWRAYAQDGHGIAIGFDPSKFSVISNSSVHPNMYVKNSFFLNNIKYLTKLEIKNTVLTLLQKYPNVVDFFKDKKSNFSDISVDLQNEITGLSMAIMHMALHTKNPAFIEEKEARLIYNHLPLYHNEDQPLNSTSRDFLNSKKMRISNGNLTSYFEFIIPDEAILEIILGPKCIFDFADVKDFLLLNGLKHDVIIDKSKASYR